MQQEESRQQHMRDKKGDLRVSVALMQKFLLLLLLFFFNFDVAVSQPCLESVATVSGIK
jgi:hypothetical protein